MGVDDQVKRAFQDLIAPELHAIRGDLRLVDQKIDGVDARLATKIDAIDQKLDGVDARLTTKIDSLKSELLAEIRRLDTMIDGADRELRTAIDIRERLATLEARRTP